MKKFYSIIISAVFAFSLAACSGEMAVQESQNAGQTLTTDTIRMEPETTHSTKEPSYTSYFSISYDTFESYSAHMSVMSLPSFVPYGTLECLGSFEQFTFLTDARFGAYTEYMYTFTDAAGYELVLYVEPNSGTDTPRGEFGTILSLPSNASDLRAHEAGTSGDLLIGDLQYCYNAQGLVGISWTQNGLWFTLYGAEPPLREYPENADTLLHDLLDAQKAQDALAGLTVTINQYLSKTSICFTTEESYDKAIAAYPLPTDFIPYDQLAQIGSFVSFTWISDALSGDMTGYQYELRDESGRIVMLRIEPIQSAPVQTTVISDPTALEDIRYLSADETAALSCNEVTYHYTEGELISITWTNNICCFTLTTPALSQYPAGLSDSFVEKMMDPDQAAAAIALVTPAEEQQTEENVTAAE